MMSKFDDQIFFRKDRKNKNKRRVLRASGW